MASGSYPWFEAVTGPVLQQGDIIPDCPVLSPEVPADLAAVLRGEGELEADVKRARLVVMTQACDLVQEKVESVVLCPIWSLEEIQEQDPVIKAMNAKARSKHWDKMRRGEMPAYHMLAEWKPLAQPVFVADFHRLYTAPKAYLEAVAQARGRRPRLLPPYREHLSQAFARYFMRVGLPVDIPSFS